MENNLPQPLGNSYKTYLKEKLKEGTRRDPEYQNLKEKIIHNTYENVIIDYNFNEPCLILFKNRLYVPNISEVKLLILNKIHK